LTKSELFNFSAGSAQNFFAKTDLNAHNEPSSRLLGCSSLALVKLVAITATMADFENSKLKSKASAAIGWNFIVLMSRQGKIRLSEFFSSYTEAQKKRILRDIAADVLPRQAKMCNIIEKGEYKFVYRRYASLYFVAGVPVEMNELIVLEQIHLFVEALDGYFNSGECQIWSNDAIKSESAVRYEI
jgi:hypothetical protein